MKFFENTSLQNVKIKDFYLFYLFKSFFIVVFFCLFCGLKGQKQFILIDAQTQKEIIKKDSLSAVKFLDSLAENNYYFTKILNVEKSGKITKINFDKDKNFNEAKVKFSPETAEFLKTKPEIFTKNLDSLKQNINQRYTNEGFAFNRVKTQFLGFENDVPKVEI